MRHFFLTALILLPSTSALGDDPQLELRRLIDESIGWIDVLPNVDGGIEPLKPVMAMRWPNAVRGSTDGATVLWVSEIGRPEAATAIFSWGGLFVHEFDSLSRSKIVAKLDGEVFRSSYRPASHG